MKPQRKSDIITIDWHTRLKAVHDSIHVQHAGDYKNLYAQKDLLDTAYYIAQFIKKLPNTSPKLSDDMLTLYADENGKEYSAFTAAEQDHIKERLQQYINATYFAVCTVINTSLETLVTQAEQGQVENIYNFEALLKANILVSGIEVLTSFSRKNNSNFTDNSIYAFEFQNEGIATSKLPEKNGGGYFFRNDRENGCQKNRDFAIVNMPEYLKEFAANMKHSLHSAFIYDAMGKAADDFQVKNIEIANKLSKKKSKSWDDINETLKAKQKALNKTDPMLVLKKQAENVLKNHEVWLDANTKTLKNGFGTVPNLYGDIAPYTRVGLDYNSDPAFSDAYQLKEIPISVAGDIASSALKKQANHDTLTSALFDLAYITGIPAPSISLNGLSISYGTENRKQYRDRSSQAYYTESDKRIHLKKMDSVSKGSLAHEWLHAFDHAVWDNIKQDLSENGYGIELNRVLTRYLDNVTKANQEPSFASENIIYLMQSPAAALSDTDEYKLLSYIQDKYPKLVSYLQEIAITGKEKAPELLPQDDAQIDEQFKPFLPRQDYLLSEVSQLYADLLKNFQEPLTEIFIERDREQSEKITLKINCAIYTALRAQDGTLGAYESQAAENYINQLKENHDKVSIAHMVVNGTEAVLEQIRQPEINRIIRAEIKQFSEEYAQAFAQTVTQHNNIEQRDIDACVQTLQGQIDDGKLAEKPYLLPITIGKITQMSVATHLLAENTVDANKSILQNFKEMRQILIDNLSQRLKANLPENLSSVGDMAAHIATGYNRLHDEVAKHVNYPNIEQTREILSKLEKTHPQIVENLRLYAHQEAQAKVEGNLGAMWEYAQALDKRNKCVYWQKNIEVFARIGEKIVSELLNEKGFVSPVLTPYQFDSKVYPSTQECRELAQSFVHMLREQVGDYSLEWQQKTQHLPVVSHYLNPEQGRVISTDVPQATLDKINPFSEHYAQPRITLPEPTVDTPKQEVAAEQKNETPSKMPSFSPENQLSFGF